MSGLQLARACGRAPESIRITSSASGPGENGHTLFAPATLHAQREAPSLRRASVEQVVGAAAVRVVETSRSRSASEPGTGFLMSRDAQMGCWAYISETATEVTWSPAPVNASAIC